MRFLFRASHAKDFELLQHSGQVLWYGVAVLALALLAVPFVLDPFYLGELSQVFIYAIAGVGLMLLVGYAGMADLLRVRNLDTYYGPIVALRGLSLSVRHGQVLAVLGANGAGKSTLLKTISGVMEPLKGSIEFEARRDSRHSAA